MKDAWGIPVLRFHYHFSDNERKMAEDMVATGREMLEAAGIEVVGTDEKVLTEGWSIHELGTARMGDRKSTRLNSSHSQISYAVFCLKKKKQPQVCSRRATCEV